MTEEAIAKRKADLAAQAEQLRANLNAIDGALQDCDYWLEQLRVPEEKAE